MSPQARYSANETDEFWMNIDDYRSAVSQDESLLLGAVLNGHVGEVSDDARDFHANHGYGICNEEGSRILECSGTHGFMLTNTYIKKRDEDLITFIS